MQPYTSTEIKEMLRPVVEQRDLKGAFDAYLLVTKRIQATANATQQPATKVDFDRASNQFGLALTELYKEQGIKAVDFVELDIYKRIFAAQIAKAMRAKDADIVKSAKKLERIMQYDLKKLTNVKDKSISKGTARLLEAVLAVEDDA